MTKRTVARSWLTFLILALAIGTSHLVGVKRHQNRDMALLDAVRSGRLEDAKRLLLAGADPNCEEMRSSWKPVDPGQTSWNTPLIFAAASGQPGMVALLLQHGASVNKEGDNGATALMAAAYFQETQTVRVLLRLGAKANARDAEGNSAVDWATQGLRRTSGSRSVIRHWQSETEEIVRLLRQAQTSNQS